MQAASLNSFAAERAQLERVLLEAGDIALRMFRADVRHWTKNISSPVSEADIAVNDLLHEKIAVAFPSDGWLSEESEDSPARLNAQRVWVIDPIDGTRAFIARREDWCISAALVVNGRPVLGVLNAPALGQMFSAEIGQGALINGVRAQASTRTSLRDALIGGPRPLLEEMDVEGLGARISPRIGSLALRLARVAEGVLDAAIASPNSHDWDLAAADLLVHEAGGVLTATSGAPVQYNLAASRHGLLVAAAPGVHGQVLAHLAGGG